MYNPDKMYEVPTIADLYADKQEALNESLAKRYNVDLTNYPLKTPSPMKRSFQSPYSNHRLPKKASPSSQAAQSAVTKFSLHSGENSLMQRDTLTDQCKPRSGVKALHGIQSIETYGGRAAAKNIPEESVKTWDSGTITQQPSVHGLIAAGYELPGHESQSRFNEADKVKADKEKAVVTPAPVHTKHEAIVQQQDRTQTILTLMGTIKLLESKNSELIASRKMVDAQLQDERISNAQLQAQVAELQHQLRLKARHEANVSKGDPYAVTQDENLNSLNVQGDSRNINTDTYSKNRPVRRPSHPVVLMTCLCL